MYFLSRLVGISSYIIVLLLMCIIISKAKNTKKVLFIYTIILAIFGYLYVPPTGADLFRIVPLMRGYAKLDFLELINYLPNTLTPIASLYYYTIGKLNNASLLPAITAFISYTNIFYILNDYSKRKNTPKIYVAFALFFIMSSGFYLEVISNIRTILSFSIIARCFYDEFFNQRKILKNIPFYLISFFIHTSAIALIIFRLIYYLFFERKTNIFNKLITTIVLIIMFYLGRDYVYLSYYKFGNYLNNNTYSWIWEYIKIFIILILLLIHINFCKKNVDQDFNKCEKNLNKYLNIFIILIFFVITEFNMFMRFSYYCTIQFIPIIINNISQKEVNKKHKIVLLLTLLISSIVLLISCIRGNLSSLKFY